jgi:hypothetical protein
MKINPQINAERQAARKNWKLEQKYPLLHHAGILEQIVERWTAEGHLALQAACREALETSRAEGQARAFAHTELYMDVCCELTSEDQMRAWTLRCNTAGFPSGNRDGHAALSHRRSSGKLGQRVSGESPKWWQAL